MAVAFFFLFCIFLFICSSIYVGLTLRHHWIADKQRREQAPLKQDPSLLS
jgi:hypothetical protein